MSKEKTKFRIFKETLNNNTEKFYPQVFDLDRNGWLFLHEGEGGLLIQSSVKLHHFVSLEEATKTLKNYLEQKHAQWLEQVQSSEYIELGEDFFENPLNTPLKKINPFEERQAHIKIA